MTRRRPKTPVLLIVAAMGVVFGDIGTSPLYTLKVCLGLAHSKGGLDDVLGICSLLFWTLVDRRVRQVRHVHHARRPRRRRRHPRAARARHAAAPVRRDDQGRHPHADRDRRRVDDDGRRHHHAGDLRHLGGRRHRHRLAGVRAVRRADLAGGDRRPVRAAAQRYGARRQAVRPRDAGVVRRRSACSARARSPSIPRCCTRSTRATPRISSGTTAWPGSRSWAASCSP